MIKNVVLFIAKRLIRFEGRLGTDGSENCWNRHNPAARYDR